MLSKDEEIQKILDERKIKHLYHFTRTRNLESILQNGIVPRNKLDSLFTDSQEVMACG